jgi:shikimate kinase
MNKSNLNDFSLPRPIVLIGMMGAGKTSLGRTVAGLFSAPFFDSDAEIEKAAGCSVARIFADYGEPESRRMERQVIARLLDDGACVLSVGGGAFMDEATRKKIEEKAFSVWLKVDPKILLERVAHHNHRPLLADGSAKETLGKLLLERTPVYAKADLTVICDDRPVSQNARLIKQAIEDAPEFQTR